MKTFKIFSKFKTAISLVIPTFIIFALAQAGSLSPSASPAATSYTLSDIYTRLTTNASATAGNHSFNATTTPTSTFQTLTDIYNAIPTIYASDLLATSTYLGVAGSIAVKSGDADASVSATSTNKLLLTPASFGGHNDWYLPTQKQLQQVYIDGSANNLPNPGYNFWSSTETYNDTANAWNVNLSHGGTNTNTKVNSAYVSRVRS